MTLVVVVWFVPIFLQLEREREKGEGTRIEGERGEGRWGGGKGGEKGQRS